MAELRARTHLVGLRRGTELEPEAVDALRGVHASFTRGFDLAVLVAARDALDGSVVRELVAM